MMKKNPDVEKTVRDIRRHTRKKYAAEEKIRVELALDEPTLSPRELAVRYTGENRCHLLQPRALS